MRIVSIAMYSNSFENIFIKTIEKSLNETSLSIICTFLEGISNFGKETFNHDLSRVNLDDSIIVDFLYIHSYIIVIITELEKDINDNNSYIYDTILEQIKDFMIELINDTHFSIKNKNDLDFFTEFLEMKINALKIGVVNFPAIELKGDIWDVMMILICELSGIPIIQKKYDNSTIDPYLISMMLTTLTSFSNLEFQKSIRVIHLGNIKLIINRSNSRLYAIIINYFSDIPNSLSIRTIKKINSLLETMGDAIDLMYDTDPSTDDEVIEKIIDNYLIEAQEIEF